MAAAAVYIHAFLTHRRLVNSHLAILARTPLMVVCVTVDIRSDQVHLILLELVFGQETLEDFFWQDDGTPLLWTLRFYAVHARVHAR
jgi:hypothetical protein